MMAQISQGKMPQQWNISEPVSIEWMEFEAWTWSSLLIKTQLPEFKDAPWRFGIEHEVLWDAETHGTDPEGRTCGDWGARRIQHQLEFLFSSFDVPKGGELFVWNASRRPREASLCQ